MVRNPHSDFVFTAFILGFNVTSVSLESSSNKALVQDVVTLVKGGITETGSGLLAVRNTDTYRKWGASLKYSPALTEFEVKMSA